VPHFLPRRHARLTGLAAGLCVTNLHKFHVALTVRHQAEQDNHWLAQQCKSPEFYSNMRQPSNLCDDVALAQADALWLHALRDVFDSGSPCGSVSCEQRVVGGLAWIFDRGVFLLCVLGLAAFVASTSMLAMHRLLTQRQLGSAPFLLHEQHPHEQHLLAQPFTPPARRAHRRRRRAQARHPLALAPRADGDDTKVMIQR
jgi:hypothetical protein